MQHLSINEMNEVVQDLSRKVWQLNELALENLRLFRSLDRRIQNLQSQLDRLNGVHGS